MTSEKRIMMHFAVCPKCNSSIIINEAIEVAIQKTREECYNIVLNELKFGKSDSRTVTLNNILDKLKETEEKKEK